MHLLARHVQEMDQKKFKTVYYQTKTGRNTKNESYEHEKKVPL